MKSDVSSIRSAGTVYLPGFMSGLRQPSLLLHLELPVLSGSNLSQLDRLLQEQFQIDLSAVNARLDEAKSKFSDPAQISCINFVVRISCLAGALLQGSRVPSFDFAKILSVTFNPAASKFRASLLAPCVDQVPLPLCHRAYKIASQISLNLLTPAWSEEQLPVLLNDIHANGVQHVHRIGGTPTIPFLLTAFEQNIPFIHRGSGVYQLGWGRHSILFDDSSNENDSAIGVKIGQNKYLTSQILAAAGLPAPVNAIVINTSQAVDAAQRIGFPVVVKPADKDRGEGVTTGVCSDDEVVAAFENAAKFSKSVLVEKHIPGVCYRITVANKKVYWSVKRGPRSVTGDGVHTVKQLVDIENSINEKKAKHLRRMPFVYDDLAVECITSAGFHVDSVPVEGQVVPLRKIESAQWGGFIETADVHPSNIALALEAANLLKLNVMGLDIISTDISQPWHTNGAVINEVNYKPLWTLSTQNAKDGLRGFLADCFPTQGRIPIEVFIGNRDALERALVRQKEFCGPGSKVFSEHSPHYVQSYW